MVMLIAREMGRIARLFWPILLAQVAQTSMGFVDTLISGRAGTLDLAAVALGSAFWMPVILFGQGVLIVMTPTIARLSGQQGEQDAAARQAHIGHELRQGLWLSALLSAPLMGVIWGLILLLPHFGYDPELSALCGRYLMACVWGVPGYMLFVTFRCGMDGLGRVRVAMLTAFVGLGLNIVGDIAFVLGKWGMPAYGGVGAGIATAMVCWCMAIMMCIQALSMRDVRHWLLERAWGLPHMPTIRRMMRIGLPTAVALLCEVTMFAAISALIAPLGAAALAANQVAMSFSGMVFMLPLSISMATCIRIGLRIGETAPDAARIAARAGMVLNLMAAASTALCVIIWRHEIPYFFIADPAVAAAASSLLVFMACYQFPDALQVVAVGCLRAYNDTRAILSICLLTYWCIALPLGYVIGRMDVIVPAMGARGFWLTTTIGLTLAAALMLRRLRQRERLFKHTLRTL